MSSNEILRSRVRVRVRIRVRIRVRVRVRVRTLMKLMWECDYLPLLGTRGKCFWSDGPTKKETTTTPSSPKAIR